MPKASEFTAASLERALAGLRLGQPLHFFESIGSTNDEARRLAEAGAPEGTLVVADEQVAGRGRGGRRWQTPRGAALAASFLLRPDLAPARLGRLTMLGGLAVAEAIEEITGRRTLLKWPNDALLDHKKVAGVLTESSAIGEKVAFAVIGMGINVNAGPAGEVNFPATSLAEAVGQPLDRTALLAALVRRLSRHYLQIGAETLRDAWAARLAWKGERVVVEANEEIIEGLAEDVDADGALLVRRESGELSRVAAGDVRLRPPPSPPTAAHAPSETTSPGERSYRPVQFIAEPIEAGFGRPPALEKKPGCPDFFVWRGVTYRVVGKVSEWHDYGRRGRRSVARNTLREPAHAAVAESRGSWGVGRDYFRVRVQGGRVFELYYDRAPKDADRRKGAWFLVSELVEEASA